MCPRACTFEAGGMAIDADTAAARWLRLAPPTGPRPSVAAPSESAQRLSGALLELEIESGFTLAHADPCNFAVGPGSIYNCVLLTNLKIFIYMVPVEFHSKQDRNPANVSESMYFRG